jgi:aralkylamine N-acetyltransferase
MIKYTFETPEDDFIKICDLYKMAGWWDGPCSSDQVSRLIANSFCFLSAWDEGQIVGMGRVISDSFSDAYIQDVFVDGKYRKQGIAGNMVGRLTDYCQKKNIHWIALIAAPGSVGVYERSGFKKMKDHTPMQFHQ